MQEEGKKQKEAKMNLFGNLFKKKTEQTTLTIVRDSHVSDTEQTTKAEPVLVKPEAIVKFSGTPAEPKLRPLDTTLPTTGTAPVKPIVIQDETETNVAGTNTVADENTKIKPKVLPQPTSPLVQQYTLVPPKQVFIDYDLFQYCKEIPVGYEQSDNNSGFHECVSLPTEVVLTYLNALKYASDEVVQDPLNRTISIIQLKGNEKLYILPNLKSPKHPISVCEENALGLLTTPEINRAITEQLKMYTRS